MADEASPMCAAKGSPELSEGNYYFHNPSRDNTTQPQHMYVCENMYMYVDVIFYLM